MSLGYPLLFGTDGWLVNMVKNFHFFHFGYHLISYTIHTLSIL